LVNSKLGTGKTMIAKAVATASESNFIFVNISDLIHSQIGESEKTLSDTFKRAKLSSPCIIFFDEIQAMFGDRQTSSQSEKKLISQFILELDEVYYSRIHVVVIGATNVPQNLDPSLLSPGRFERLMLIGPPTREARKSILENMFHKMKFSKEVFEHMEDIVERTEGYTGADIVNICQKSGLIELKNLDQREVNEISLESLLKSLENSKPSISKDLKEFYENWNEFN
jgi:transitional endoplasmic reticulum ATPase